MHITPTSNRIRSYGWIIIRILSYVLHNCGSLYAIYSFYNTQIQIGDTLESREPVNTSRPPKNFGRNTKRQKLHGPFQREKDEGGMERKRTLMMQPTPPSLPQHSSPPSSPTPPISPLQLPDPDQRPYQPPCCPAMRIRWVMHVRHLPGLAVPPRRVYFHAGHPRQVHPEWT
ncbi:hypothetical protein EDC04DRAFT_1490862 [Pisolithus marmoratus]|nr:hypothetical protein EDC04DRAFT_1490862 [Pisolithus marmoratus]